MAEMRVLAVREAADILGVSTQRVRQMIGDGQLAARRSSSGWLVPERAVVERAASIGRGRPAEPRTAWAAIRLLDALATRDAGEEAPTRSLLREALTDRRMRYRVLGLLAALPDPVEDPAPWRRLLSARGRTRRWWVHPGLVDRLVADPRVSRGGSTAIAGGSGLTGGPNHLDLYVTADDLDDLIQRYRLREDPDGQVALVTVPSSVPTEWAPVYGGIVPDPAALADLLDEDDARARDVATHRLRDLQRALLSLPKANADLEPVGSAPARSGVAAARDRE